MARTARRRTTGVFSRYVSDAGQDPISGPARGFRNLADVEDGRRPVAGGITPRSFVEARVAERAGHHTAEQVQMTCSFARAERLLGREYHGRFLIELLQNAADAWRKAGEPGRRSRLSILIEDGPSLVVANQGEGFPASVVIESLGHIGRSTKAQGEAIGHKGIGFKSVLEISLTPELYSDLQAPTPGLAVRFDQRRALSLIKRASSDWDKLVGEVDDIGADELAAVPILRFPHWVDDVPPVVSELATAGFDTVVRLPFDRTRLDETAWLRTVRDALGDVTDEILLLLGTFEEVRIEDRLRGTVEVITPSLHEAAPSGDGVTRELVTVSRDNRTTSRWRLYRRTLPDTHDLAGEIAVGMRLGVDSGDIVTAVPGQPSAPFFLF